MDNRSYYDEFADWYEKERGRGYHQLIDDLEIEVVERYSRDAVGTKLRRSASHWAAGAWPVSWGSSHPSCFR